MNKSEFSQIRHTLDMTQEQLSQVLCVSPKAIQSFEQGWRNVPTYVETPPRIETFNEYG